MLEQTAVRRRALREVLKRHLRVRLAVRHSERIAGGQVRNRET